MRKTTDERFAVQRQMVIRERLVMHGYASIAELAGHFEVPEATIQRDLDELESQGVIQRVFAGAVTNAPMFFEMSIHAKAGQNHEEKMRIGKAAAALVKNGETIFLDSGTTTHQIARHLLEMNITVVTNALNIAAEFSRSISVEVKLAGGDLHKATMYTSGPHTNEFFHTFRADKLFMAVEGADTHSGFTVPDPENAENKKAMVRAAREVYVVTDHSKLGRRTAHSIIPVEKANRLITGVEAGAEMIETLRAQIDVMLV